MKTRLLILIGLGLLGACSRKGTNLLVGNFGTTLVESSGGKQVAAVGTILGQSLVVQVNDDQGTAVAGAPVGVRGPGGISFNPATGTTDSNGQFTTNVTLGSMAGRYQITAYTFTKAQKRVELKLEEIALGHQQQVGSQINDKYCSRCHDPESTPEKVSNYDNLTTKPHPFNEGDTLNKISDADLLAIISYGGPALNKSSLMPPYGHTLSKTEIHAVLAYIRLLSDPPYQASEIAYAQR